MKLPKTFLAVNLSDAFTFQEKPHLSDSEGLEMRPAEQEQVPPESIDPAATIMEETTTEKPTGERKSDPPRSEGEGGGGGEN